MLAWLFGKEKTDLKLLILTASSVCESSFTITAYTSV